MLEIWGRENSINVQKVLWCCQELGLDYERLDAGGAFGRTSEPDFLALNPTGLVPTLIDDGFALWESNAIVRYLCSQYGEGVLQPTDAHERARADQWMDWQTAMVWARFRPVFIALVRTPAAERDASAVAASVKATAQLLAILDHHLADQAHVAGPRFSMGDIPLGAAVHRWFNLDIERPCMPNLRAWYERLQERPAYENVVTSIALT